MRRIEIPKEAIERHRDTLGKEILSFLNRLANRQSVIWNVDGGGSYIPTNAVNPQAVIGYWDWLYKEFKTKEILTATPYVIAKFAKDNENQRQNLDPNDLTQIDETCGLLFNYAAFRESNVLVGPNTSGLILWSQNKKHKASWKEWGIAEFVRLLDVRYCPYCNAETVGTARLPERIHVPDIDHIFPKMKYPLLSLSLYNLVPACNRCNSRFKKVKDMLEGWNVNHPLPSLHPYVHNSYKYIRFDYRPKSVGNLFIRPQVEDSPLTVSPVKDGDDRARCYLNDYHINEIYRDVYAEEINEMIRMEAICSKDFINTMRDLYELDDSDFDKLFRRSSLDPRKINHFRFAKLIIDLHQAIGSDINARKKREIEARLREKFRL